MTNPSDPPPNPDGGDPSMEEILASIRRILNDDEAPADEPGEAPAAPESDVLVLDETMIVAADEAPSAVIEAKSASHDDFDAIPFQPVAPEPVTPVITPPMPADPPHLPIEAGMPAPPVDPWEAPDLLAPAAAAAAASSVGSLMRTLAASRAPHVYAGGPTLEDMVRAELRPMLKEWLDLHLPPMVERLVRAEIERVVGRGDS